MRYVSTLDQSYNPYLWLTYILDLYFDNVCSYVDNIVFARLMLNCVW